MTDGNAQERASSAQTKRLAVVDELVHELLGALSDVGLDAQEVQLLRMSEGLYQLKIATYNADHTPGVYTWSNGDVVEVEPPVALSGIAGGES